MKNGLRTWLIRRLGGVTLGELACGGLSDPLVKNRSEWTPVKIVATASAPLGAGDRGDEYCRFALRRELELRLSERPELLRVEKETDGQRVNYRAEIRILAPQEEA